MDYVLEGRPISVLLVEDSPSDVELTRQTLRDAKVANRLSVATDGEEAMAFLRQEGKFAGASRPDIILLDLNLPRKDGREVLGEIKADEELMRIPVIVLTTSATDTDIADVYGKHASCYVQKPVDLDAFIHVVQSIEEFWLAVVRLPAR